MKILSGDIALYEIIIRRYNPYLFKVGRSYGFNHPDTEDLMQETYINAYLNLAKFENRSSFKTWLVKIMLNNCYHKKHKFNTRIEMTTDGNINEHEVPLNSHPGNNDSFLNKELGHILEIALMQIPEDYRLVFSLRELSGLTTLETAETLNITESNVKVRLNRAKRLLRNEIEKKYSPSEIFEFNQVYCNRMVKNVMEKIDRMSKNIENTNN
jgi:RNA polymerase sigma-70 factor (ECF subfamily)